MARPGFRSLFPCTARDVPSRAPERPGSTTAQQPATRRGAPARTDGGDPHDYQTGPPGLDGWLAKAKRVLAEARDDALSPSTAPGPWDAHRTERATTLAELDAHLEELLYRLVFGPGRWVLIVEDTLRRYVQVLPFEDGSLVAEVASNNYLEDDQRWGDAD